MTTNSFRCIMAWIVASVFLFRGGNAMRQRVVARAWPTANADVTESRAGWIEVPQSVRRSMWKYALHLRYSFAVGGRGFTGSRASFGPWGDDENMNPLATAIARTYPVGSRVTIFYDPADPSRSVIDRGLRASSLVALLLGVLSAYVGWSYSRRVEAEKRGLMPKSDA